MSRITAALLVATLPLLGVSAPAWAGRPSPDIAARTAPQPAPGHLLMMDTATTPALASVQAWQAASPYRAIAVYIPAKSAFDVRYDKTQTNLTADWVRQVRAGGWQVLPIYVGLQASCSSFSKRMAASTAKARAQGTAMAADAAAAVYRLGLPVSAPIAYDLEGYPGGNAKCTAAAQAMQAGWTTRLHQLGRNSALYGSVNSTITDVTHASMDPAYPRPDALWVARWDGQANTTFDVPPATMWVGRRLHQFTGGGKETYGGVTINVDESAVQSSVFRLPPPDRTAPRLVSPAVRSTRSGHVTLAWKHSDPSGVAHYQVQVRKGSHWSAPKSLKKTKTTKTRLAVKAGGAACLRVRATDKAGNTTGWEKVCAYRWRNGSTLRGKGWKRAGTALTVGHSHKTARSRPVSGRRFGFTISGHNTFEVRVAGRMIGKVGPGTHWLTLPRSVHGKVSLRSLRGHKARLKSWIVTP